MITKYRFSLFAQKELRVFDKFNLFGGPRDFIFIYMGAPERAPEIEKVLSTRKFKNYYSTAGLFKVVYRDPKMTKKSVG